MRWLRLAQFLAQIARAVRAVGGLFELALDAGDFALERLQLFHRAAQPAGQAAPRRRC